MKQTRNMLIGIVAATAWLLAGNVGTLKTFTANTTAKASEVNGNFNAVKTAVNGNVQDIKTNANDIATNAHDITTNTGNITTNAHDITTNTSSINTVKGDYVSSVTAGTGLTGGGNSGNVTLKPADGYVSINAAAFEASLTNSSSCVIYRGLTQFKFNSLSTYPSCEAIANVSLPDHATITSFECMVNKDNNTSTTLEVFFRRVTPMLTSYLIAKLSTNVSGGSQLLSAPNIYDPVIDNGSNLNYVIRFNPPNNTDTSEGENNIIYGCRIGYTY